MGGTKTANAVGGIATFSSLSIDKAGTGYTWPWVDPAGATKLFTLPAKARFDAATPFAQP